MIMQTESTVQTSVMRFQTGFLWAALRFQVACQTPFQAA